MLVALTRTTFVAAAPPKVTVAPLWKPVPEIVTLVPPAARPAGGVTPVTVTDDGAVTVTLADFASVQPAAVVTVTLRMSVPAAPAVKPIVRVPLPELIVPLEMVQAYVAPTPASATLAVPLAPAVIVEA